MRMSYFSSLKGPSSIVPCSDLKIDTYYLPTYIPGTSLIYPWRPDLIEDSGLPYLHKDLHKAVKPPTSNINDPTHP